ncbi:TolC family outer membrane protein [Coralloluteibacterium stylophorae]|uniref:TolC family outer membrane protein n=1 Tax=Coralloluteibacterium stylophorae TaxID=1776034 RepID=A0A8J7VU32_9GAMM|nr:TolC family outer membrane protein [Coralloluteibacterium stylophorae]MBS7458501.1 TolC family outer membrane protein [Coralloluteibacterium stylophorae]
MTRLRTLSLAIVLGLGAASSANATDLLEAYQAARMSDPQLSQADAERLATGENVPLARSALLPQVGGSATLTESDSDSYSAGTVEGEILGTDSSSVIRQRDYAVSLEQSIFDWADWTSLRAARERATQADFEYEAEADALFVRTAEAYFNVLTAIETLASARAQEQAVKRQLDQAEQRLEVGLAPITDVHEAQAGYDSARASAILAQTQLNDAYEALTEITGQQTEDLRGLDPDYEPAAPVPEDVDAWVDQALTGNPSIQAAELAASAAEHDIDTARAGHLPTLTASVSYGKGASWGTQTLATGDRMIDTANDGTTVGVRLNVPIFSGGAVRARVRQAGYQRDAVLDLLEQTRRSINRSTRSIYDAVVAGISEVEARRAAVVSARSAYDASEAGLEVGTRTIVEVLITQQNLFAAQREYAAARHNFLVNTLRLKQATGTIAYEDIAAINRLLTTDAEAALDPEAIKESATPDMGVPPATIPRND